MSEEAFNLSDHIDEADDGMSSYIDFYVITNDGTIFYSPSSESRLSNISVWYKDKRFN